MTTRRRFLGLLGAAAAVPGVVVKGATPHEVGDIRFGDGIPSLDHTWEKREELEQPRHGIIEALYCRRHQGWEEWIKTRGPIGGEARTVEYSAAAPEWHAIHEWSVDWNDHDGWSFDWDSYWRRWTVTRRRNDHDGWSFDWDSYNALRNAVHGAPP